MDGDFIGFDSPEHDAAQAKCWHFVTHAINAETRRAAWQALTHARHTGSDEGIILGLARFGEECEHRLAPTATDALLRVVREHAEENYEHDGWDYVVEAWDDAYLREILVREKAFTVEKALAAVGAVVKMLDERRKEIQATAF